MKSITLLLSFTFLACIAFSQDSLWTKKQVSEILSFNIPSNFSTSQILFVQEYNGEEGDYVYVVRHYDTTMKVESEERFKVSLIGFVDGMLQDSSLAGYKIIINDTSIGSTKGLFVKLNSRGNQSTFKHIYFYVTIANGHFYVFNALSQATVEKSSQINLFFQSILFDPKKINESSYSFNFRFEN